MWHITNFKAVAISDIVTHAEQLSNMFFSTILGLATFGYVSGPSARTMQPKPRQARPPPTNPSTPEQPTDSSLQRL